MDKDTIDSRNHRKITKYLSSLCEKTSNLEKLMQILVTSQILEESEYIAITELNITSYERNYEFYTIIQNKAKINPEAFSKLCNALIATTQGHLVEKLNEVGADSFDTYSADLPMLRIQRQTICKNFERLTEGLSAPVLTGLLTILVEGQVLNTSEVEEIKNKNSTTKNRVAQLLLKLLDKRPNAFPHLINGLRKTNQCHIVNQILEDVNSPTLQYDLADIKPVLEKFYIDTTNFIPVALRDNKWFDINQTPIKTFTGREDMLLKIHESIMSQQSFWDAEKIPKFSIIWGLGGVGKTQAVRKYIYTYHKDSNVIWINAKDFLTARESFFRLAENELGIRTKSDNANLKPIHTIVKEVYAFFGDKKSLFIFDNAENFVEDRDTEGIDQFMPMGITAHVHPWVLITSQNKHWDSPQEFDIIEMKPFSKPESMQFIKKSLSLETTSNSDIESLEEFEDMVDLANLMKGLPLALHQAVDLINQNKIAFKNLGISYGIKEYINNFEEESKRLLNHKIYASISSHRHPHLDTAYITGQISLEGMKSENYGDEAAKILNIIAYFHYQDVQSLMLLEIISEKKRLCLALELLKKYSFISISEGLIQIHSVTQEVVRITLQETNQEQFFIDQGLQLLKSKLPTDPAAIFSEYSQKYFFPHAVTTWDVGVNYPELVRKYSDYLVKVQGFLIAIGNPKKANNWGSKTKNQLKLNPDDPYDPGMLNQCSQLLTTFMSGDNQGTHEILTQLLSAASTIDPSKASSFASRDQTALGFIKTLSNYVDPGDKPLAFANDSTLVSSLMASLTSMLNSETASESKSQTSQANDPFSIASLLKLVTSGLDSKTGNHPEVFQNLTEFQANINKSASSQELAGVSNALNLLRSSGLNDMNKTSEASKLLQLYDPKLSISGSKSSPNEYERPQVNLNDLQLASCNAMALKRNGKLDEALLLLNETRQILVREYTEAHPLRFDIDIEIGTTLIALNRYQESYDLLSKTCGDSKLALGQEDSKTFCANLALIWAMDRLGMTDQAVHNAIGAYEMALTAFGKDHEISKEVQQVLDILLKKIDTESLD